MRRIACALIHHPVLDRAGSIVTTAVTNLDLHDIARSSHTYGLAGFYVAHPIAAQRELVERVRSHWVGGSGARRIPDRSPAMATVTVVTSLDEAVERYGAGAPIELWATSAQSRQALVLSHTEARRRLSEPGPDVLVLFGTGWGLAAAVHERCTVQLAPIRSPRPDAYNHLSVRAAAAITFDRLLSPDAPVPATPA